MLSEGMFSALAAAMAVRRRGFLSGSPPPLAAIVISLIRRVKILPRLASSAPFLCLIVAHLEWPDMQNLDQDFQFRMPLTQGTRRMKRKQSVRARRDYSTAKSRYAARRLAPLLSPAV